MKIKALKIYGMYGYMDKEIYFNDDENYLVGINGSGKTTIIKILDSFLRKDFTFLEKNTFKDIIIETDDNLYRMYRTSTIDNSEIKFYIFDEKFSTSTKNNYINDRKEEIKALEMKIENLEKNMVLAQDNTQLKTLTIEKTEKAVEISQEELKTYVLTPEQTKTYISNFPFISIGIDKEFEEKNLIIDELKKEENKSFKEKTEIINSLFPIQKVEFLLQDIGKKFLQFKSQIMSNKVKKINDLTEIKEKFENTSKSSDLEILIEIEIELERLLKFVEIINNFLEDSYKKLNFNDVLGEFSFDALNKEREVIKIIENLNYLSSGEKQLIVLFTELYFNLKENTIILIDEPEKSLHIEWQEKFLPALKKIIGPISDKVQLIIATHSPKLVENIESYQYIPLYPYNEVNKSE